MLQDVDNTTAADQPAVSVHNHAVSKKSQRVSQGVYVIDYAEQAAHGIPDKHKIGLAYVLMSVCAEEQIASPALLDNFGQARLIDGQSVAVPGLDPGFVYVDHDYFDLWTLQCNLRHGRSADISSSYARNFHCSLTTAPT